MRKLLPLAVLALTVVVMAQSPVLLKDINTLPQPDPSSSPYPETSHWSHNYQMYYKFAHTAGGNIFFEANNGTSGAELFMATPTPGSAKLVKDIVPGTGSGYIYYLTTAGNKVFFEADDGTNGDEPWVSDGTAAGTIMLSNYSGSSNGDMYYPIAMGNYCYYCTRSASGYDLVKSDGTVAGTTVVKNFTSYWYYPTLLGNKIIFRGNDGTNGYEAWVTDGTAAGTMMLKDAYAGSSSGYCYYPVEMGGKVYYWATDGSYALWSTDGTTTGTVKIGTPTGWNTSYWYYPMSIGNKIIFRGNTSATGYEPWASDGTLAGTYELVDSYTGTSNGYFYDPATAGGKCYFRSNTSSSSYNLYVTDGTVKGTTLLKTFPGSGPYDMEGLGSKVLFEGDDGGGAGDELWITDGTVAGTQLLKDIYPGASNSDPMYMTEVGSIAFFRANDGLTGTELWITDGTAAGTKLHTNIYAATTTGTQASSPSYFTNAYGTTYFEANDGNGYRLWKTDGTTAGTVMVHPTVDPYLSYSKTYMTKEVVALGNKFFFRGNDGTSGEEAWVTDGTAAGTKMLVDAYSGTSSGQFYYPVVFQDHIWWWGYTGSCYNLYKSDGVTTTKVTDTTTVGLGSYWYYPVVLGNKIIFRGYNSSTCGYEPWVTDGTAAGTMILKDNNPGTSSGYVYNPYPYNGKVYYRAYNGTSSTTVLWETDGTPAGTKIFQTGVAANNTPLVAGGKLFFEGSSCFWVTDGTTAGTTKITASTYFDYPCAHGNGKVYFFGRDSSSNRCLHETDGTATGTKAVWDPQPSYSSNYGYDIISTGSRYLCFEQYTSSSTSYINNYYTEFAYYDSVTNKGMIIDMYPGTSGGYFNYPCHAGNGLVIGSINNGTLGYEPYVIDFGATVLQYGVGHGPLLASTDPILGANMTISIPNLPTSAGAVAIFGAPTTNPVMLAGSGLYFDLTLIYGVFPVPATGLTVAVPKISGLVGAQIAAQGFVAPGTGFAGVDFTQGLVGTFNK